MSIEVHSFGDGYRLYIEPNEDRPGHAVTVVSPNGSSASLEFIEQEGEWSDGEDVALPVPDYLEHRVLDELKRLGVER